MLKRKNVVTILIAMLLIICYFKLGFTNSEVAEGFPIPVEASLLKKGNNDGAGYEYYKLSYAREENGLTPWYEIAIWLRGWREAETMGASRDYVKGDKNVSIAVFTKEINVISYEK